MPKSVIAPVKPELLVWARKSSRYQIAEAAKRAVVSVETLTKWEAGETKPTIRQLEKLANVYKRPLAVFFLPKPPNEYDKPFDALDLHDFRRLPEYQTGVFSPALVLELRKAEDRREVILDLLTQLNEAPADFSLKADPGESPEDLAQRMRIVLGVTLEQQIAWNGTSTAFKNWVATIERVGILVFQTGIYQKRDVPVSEMRGVAISVSRLPIIIVNGKDSLNARIFTLMHEFCHLLVGVSGVSDVTINYWSPLSPDEEIEIFCNRFAAEMLVPMKNFLNSNIVKGHKLNSDWSDQEILELAKHFVVSQEVIVRRLLTAQLVTVDYYLRKRQEFRDRYAENQKDKGEKKQILIPRDRLLEKYHGGQYITTVLEAYHNDVIGLGDALDYLDAKTKSFKKLEQRLSI